ncbi:hypothetical protein IMCC26256_111832 [Actinobacteria bacterium IMCC26256]|nr:hypothetical protein IMCC26256_111832 [Actinobacteria bacterium IMCC26256]
MTNDETNNDETPNNPDKALAARGHDDEIREAILSKSVFEFIFTESDLKQAVTGQLPREIADAASVSFACFDDDREYDWFEDDVRVDIFGGGGRYTFMAEDVREALTELLLPALRDRYVPADIWPGRSGVDGGCARCYGADFSNHVHVQYVIRRQMAGTKSQRAEAWEALKYAELLDETGLIDRNVLGLEMIRDGASSRSVAFHLIGRLAEQSVTALENWSVSDRERVGTMLADLAMSTPELFFRTSMEAFQRALPS